MTHEIKPASKWRTCQNLSWFFGRPMWAIEECDNNGPSWPFTTVTVIAYAFDLEMAESLVKGLA